MDFSSGLTISFSSLRIRGGSAADYRTLVHQNSPPKSKKSPRRTDSDSFGGLADFFSFFGGLLVHGSAAYLWRIRGGSAADFWVRGRVRADPRRIHFSPRGKCTRRIRHRSAQVRGGSAAVPRRTRVRPFNSPGLVYGKFYDLSPEFRLL